MVTAEPLMLERRRRDLTKCRPLQGSLKAPKPCFFDADNRRLVALERAGPCLVAVRCSVGRSSGHAFFHCLVQEMVEGGRNGYDVR
jgi:hypothetical protein